MTDFIAFLSRARRASSDVAVIIDIAMGWEEFSGWEWAGHRKRLQEAEEVFESIQSMEPISNPVERAQVVALGLRSVTNFLTAAMDHNFVLTHPSVSDHLFALRSEAESLIAA